MKQIVAVLGSTVGMFAAQAHAALPTGVVEAIDTAGADAVTAIGAMIGAAVLVFAVRKVLKLFGW